MSWCKLIPGHLEGLHMQARAAFIIFAAACCAAAQTPAHQHAGEAAVPLQPLAQQVRRLEDAMNYLGQPFPAADHGAINAAIANADEGAAVAELEKILDRYALAIVDINAESIANRRQRAPLFGAP